MALLLVMGCARKPMDATLPFEVPDRFTSTGEAGLLSEWWTEFNDPELNRVVDSALADNFDIRASWERLMAANAVVDRESSSLFPQISANLQGETGSGQTAFDVNDNLRLGLTAQYEIDLWGRIRSAVDAERYRADAARTAYHAAAISLSAELVLTWYRLAEAEMQSQIAREQTQTNEIVLNLLRSRFGSGQVRSVDILRQDQLLEASLEEELIHESEIRILQNRLAILAGYPPQELVQVPDIPLPDLPELPQTGIPLELVKRRPDVQTTYYQLQAADRDLASAISSRYPRLSLNLLFSTQGGVEDLFRQWAWSISGNLLAPLIYFGRLKAEATRNEAVRNQRLYEYGAAVLTAFREVEDALLLEMQQVKRIESIEKQHDLALKAYDQLRIEYLNGMSNYLDVLTALEQEQELRRDLATARLVLIEYRVGLYRALAGAIDEEEPISDEQGS